MVPKLTQYVLCKNVTYTRKLTKVIIVKHWQYGIYSSGTKMTWKARKGPLETIEWHWNIKPFKIQTSFDHSKFERFRYSSPHCIYLMFFSTGQLRLFSWWFWLRRWQRRKWRCRHWQPSLNHRLFPPPQDVVRKPVPDRFVQIGFTEKEGQARGGGGGGGGDEAAVADCHRRFWGICAKSFAEFHS